MYIWTREMAPVGLEALVSSPWLGWKEGPRSMSAIDCRPRRRPRRSSVEEEAAPLRGRGASRHTLSVLPSSRPTPEKPQLFTKQTDCVDWLWFPVNTVKGGQKKREVGFFL